MRKDEEVIYLRAKRVKTIGIFPFFGSPPPPLFWLTKSMGMTKIKLNTTCNMAQAGPITDYNFACNRNTKKQSIKIWSWQKEEKQLCASKFFFDISPCFWHPHKFLSLDLVYKMRPKSRLKTRLKLKSLS